MLLKENLDFICPVKIGSGNKALEHLPVDLSALNAKKPLIITNKYITTDGLIKNIINAFKSSGLVIGVYDAIDEKPGLETIKILSTLYKDKGFDSIIAVGGGKLADLAKVLNIVVSGSPEDLEKYSGVNNIPKPLKPFVYVPVSLATGTEASRNAVIGDLSFSSHYLMPDIVVIDPRMLKQEKPENIINLAMAALTRSSEVYANPLTDPFASSYAHVAIDFVMSYLETIVKNQIAEKGWFAIITHEFKNKKARVALANAAVAADCVYSNVPAGIAQKLGIEVSKNCDLKSGIAMGIMLPYVLEFNSYRKGHESEKFMLPVAGLDVYCSTPVGQRFDSAIGKIRHLQNEIYIISSATIPRTLGDAGLPKEMLSKIAEKIAGDGYDKDACLLILEHAYEGKPVTP